MQVIKSISGIRDVVQKLKSGGKSTALVPTMGALHEGHLALIRKALGHADTVIVSIFVNPTQFAPGEDFERYPRPVQEDLAACEREGVSVVFLPEKEELYQGDAFIGFEIKGLAAHLCGKSRPGHFNGVVQVVNKLFNIVRPDVAVFGQKDIQQFRILEQMAKEFDHGIEIIMGETIREDDGLALSSRNRYLGREERKKAPSLNRALQNIAIAAGAGADPRALTKTQIGLLEGDGIRVDYLEIVDYESLQPVDSLLPGRKHIVAGAIFLGKTRLIDNRIFEIA